MQNVLREFFENQKAVLNSGHNFLGTDVILLEVPAEHASFRSDPSSRLIQHVNCHLRDSSTRLNMCTINPTKLKISKSRTGKKTFWWRPPGRIQSYFKLFLLLHAWIQYYMEIKSSRINIFTHFTTLYTHTLSNFTHTSKYLGALQISSKQPASQISLVCFNIIPRLTNWRHL